MKGHADAETLAAFREELLSRRKAARVSAHLAACSRCAELDAQLTEVSALLTTSAAPPMPDALTARIEAAIAAEAAARSTTAADGGIAAADGGVPAADGGVPVGAARAGAGPRDRAARPSRPAGGPGRSRLALRVAAVAAAFAVVAGGGYGAARLLSGSPEATSSAGSGGVGAPAFRENSKAPPAPSGALRAPGGQAGSGSSSYPLVVSSGTNYQPRQLKAQVSAVLTQHGAHAATGSGPSSGGQHAASVAPPPACVSHVTGGKPPLLVDLAKYQGRPATIIVIPGATSGTLRALVVGGRCQATTDHVIATTTFPSSG